MEKAKREIQELNAFQSRAQASFRADRDVLTDASDALAAKVLEVNQAQQQCRKLEGQIVRSPDRMKREIAMMGNALKGERENVKLAEQKTRELAVRVQGIDQTKADLIKAAKQIDEVASELSRLKEARSSYEQSADSAAAQAQELKEVAAREHQIRREIEMIIERATRAADQQVCALRSATYRRSQMNTQYAALLSRAHRGRATPHPAAPWRFCRHAGSQTGNRRPVGGVGQTRDR